MHDCGGLYAGKLHSERSHSDSLSRSLDLVGLEGHWVARVLIPGRLSIKTTSAPGSGRRYGSSTRLRIGVQAIDRADADAWSGRRSRSRRLRASAFLHGECRPSPTSREAEDSDALEAPRAGPEGAEICRQASGGGVKVVHGAGI